MNPGETVSDSGPSFSVRDIAAFLFIVHLQEDCGVTDKGKISHLE